MTRCGFTLLNFQESQKGQSPQQTLFFVTPFSSGDQSECGVTVFVAQGLTAQPIPIRRPFSTAVGIQNCQADLPHVWLVLHADRSPGMQRLQKGCKGLRETYHRSFPVMGSVHPQPAQSSSQLSSLRS